MNNGTIAQWSLKIASLVAVCMIAIAASDDAWEITPASASSALLIVAFDEDDTDDTVESMPACAVNKIDGSDVCSSGRNRSDVVDRVHIRKEGYRRYTQRGPPDPGSNRPRLLESIYPNVPAADAVAEVGIGANTERNSGHWKSTARMIRASESSHRTAVAMSQQLHPGRTLRHALRVAAAAIAFHKGAP